MNVFLDLNIKITFLLFFFSCPLIRRQQKNKICDFCAEKDHYFHELQKIGIVKEISCDRCETFGFKCYKMSFKFH